MKKSEPFVIILCGGQSLRLWPLTHYKSKNFLDIFGFSPLEVTIKRFLKVTSPDKIILVANKKEKKTLTRLKIRKGNIILEPQSKNTAAAVLLALLHLQKCPEANVIISPVDHYIKREKEFYRALNTSLKAARAGFISTLGIKPAKPSPDFGYIKAGKIKIKGVHQVKKFIEKPNVKTARRLLRQGNCFYNSGMFIASVQTLLGEYRRYYSKYHDFVNAFSRKKIAKTYQQINNIPFDRAIMEKTKKACLVKAKFTWKDFGNWKTIYEMLAKDNSNNVKKGAIHSEKSSNNLFYVGEADKRLLVMGLDDVFFIDTKHYALLTTRAHLDNLKAVLKKLTR